VARLAELSDYLTKPNLERSDVLKRICTTTTAMIPNASMVSLWTFGPEREYIKSLINFNVEAQSFTENVVLKREDFPRYFEAIVEKELVVASDARSHPMTECFSDSYFVPNDIYSLLDFVLHKNFNPVGVVCCEATGGAITWTATDIENIRTLAMLVSFYFEV